MKVSWRLGEEQQPTSQVEVVGIYSNEPEFVYFDGECWYDRNHSEVFAPIWWMYLPLRPDE